MKNQKELIISADAVELSHLPSDSPLTVSVGENTLVVVPERMTALQAANAINALTDIASELVRAIHDACGTCQEQTEQEGDCPFGDVCDPDRCPYADMDGPEVELSDAARRTLGIPLAAKLELLPDLGEGLVCAADYKHDITDVPESVQNLLAICGVCPGKLDEVIMNEVEVWHG